MRQHWFLQHFGIISRAAQFLVWLTGAASWIKGAWDGYPLPWLLFLMVGSTAMASLFSYYFLKIGDYLFEQAADAQLGGALADALEERLGVGEATQTTRQAANLWMSRLPVGPEFNTRFRWIKHAIYNGHVSGEPLNAVGSPDALTRASSAELAEFFRRRNWRQLVIVPPGTYDT